MALPVLIFMKRIFLGLALLSLVSIGNAQTAADYFSLQTSVTNIAAQSTNTTAGPIKFFYAGESPLRIWLSANGNTANSANGLTVKLSTASGNDTTTNNFDSASLSYIRLSLTNALGATSTTVSDRFILSGARYIRVGQIENAYAGAVSNITINVGYPTTK